MSSSTTQKAAKEETGPLQPEVKAKDNGEHCKKTLGEELFLVHLNRFDKLERSPADFDHTTNPKEVVETISEATTADATAAPEAVASAIASSTTTKESAATTTPATGHSITKNRSTSIGEELWEVHCRRTQGLPPDYDEDQDADGDDTKMKDAAADREQPKKKTGGKNKAVSADTAAGGATNHPKRIKQVVVEPREIHLRNRDVKVQATTATTTTATKGH